MTTSATPQSAARPWQGVIGRFFTPLDFITYVRMLRFTQWRPSFIVLHNTVEPTFAAWHRHSGPAWMKGFEQYYRYDKQWSAGPHCFVDDHGIWVFTPLTVHGIHSPSWNTISWGVEMVGDYDHEVLSVEVEQNTASCIATLSDVIGLDPLTMRLHKEDHATTHKCPGVRVNKLRMITMVVDKIRRRHAGDHVPRKIDAATFEGLDVGGSSTAPSTGPSRSPSTDPNDAGALGS